jgi:FtsP/CotA-like multicopper oxidase with cupredoxin domain
VPWNTSHALRHDLAARVHQGNADNIFLTVQPGQTQDFEIRIPANHPPGLFWYHPYAHHFSNEQVGNGMSGALIVERLLDSFPAVRGIRERVLLLKDIQLEKGHIADRSIGNVGANLYYRLRLDGHRFYQVARDGNRFTRIVPTDELFIPPGGRVEVLVQGGGRGAHLLRTSR